MYSFCLSLFISSIVIASTVNQTDWSGGPGVQGPVLNWGSCYWTSDNIAGNTFGKARLAFLPPMKYTVDDSLYGAFSVYPADINSDGNTDILGSALYGDDIYWWENTDGSGMAWTRYVITEDFDGAWSVCSSDLDGDGDADVLGAGFYCDDITWWENTEGTGTVWAEHIIDGDFEAAKYVCTVDFDDDGDADVLGASNSGSGIIWWENADGSGTVWAEHIVDGNYFAWMIHSADLDNDGDPDVLGSYYSPFFTGNITWWENADGSGTYWIKHTIDDDFDGAKSVYSSDIDSDGDADVLGAASEDGDITWWENADGSGDNWIEHKVDGNYFGAWAVYSADVDGDGDEDILGSSESPGSTTWWENTNGAGTNWTEHTLDENLGASSFFDADIDGDGCCDILVSYFYSTIAWWDFRKYSPLGTLESSIIDAGDVSEWNTFLAGSQQPSGTSVLFQFRSSDDSSDMGAWSDTVFSSSVQLEGILADFTGYLQYRVILETSDPAISPELAFVTFSYALEVGVAEGESSEVQSYSLHATENPSRGFFSALVSIPESGSIDLFLYDVSGRVVAEASQEFPSGTHSVVFTGLAEGVYFCTMHTGEFSATERIVVLK